MTVPTATNTCTSSLSIPAAADASRAILEEFAKEENTRVSSISSFLKAHRLESLSLTTAWRWMRLLGFHYDTRKKSFYIDGHERQDVVANRITFCKQYLTEFEPYC